MKGGSRMSGESAGFLHKGEVVAKSGMKIFEPPRKRSSPRSSCFLNSSLFLLGVLSGSTRTPKLQGDSLEF
jgi:hypothetical protein